MSMKAAEHHRKAAEHHEHAAKHHHAAAEHDDAGNHEKAAHHWPGLPRATTPTPKNMASTLPRLI